MGKEVLEIDTQKYYGELLNFSCEFKQKMNEEKLHLPYHLNVIDEMHINENGHSRILCKLLCYTNSKGEYELLESLIDYVKRVSYLQDFGKIEIEKPVITQEKERIDLWVRDNNYALIFENKVYNAADQDAQICRYIEKTKNNNLKKYCDEQIFVVYLSKDGKEPDLQSWNNYKDVFSTRYVNLSFNRDILSWLKQDVFPNIREKDECLKSAVRQYIDYLEGLFFLRTNTMNEILGKLISNRFELDKCEDEKAKARLLQDKMNEMGELIDAMSFLRGENRKIIYGEWKKETKNRFPDFNPAAVALTSVTFDKIDGKKMNVVIDENSEGLYCEVHIHSSEKDRTITNCQKIMELQKDILSHKNDVSIWEYFGADDYDEVFDMFLKVVERCKTLID